MFFVLHKCFVLTNETSGDALQIRITHKYGGHGKRKNSEIDQSFGCPQSSTDLSVKSKNTIDYI